MTNFLNVLALIVKLLPLIKDAVITLEAMFPQSGVGTSKKEILNKMLESAIGTSSELQLLFTSAIPAIQPIIDLIANLCTKNNSK